MWLKGIIKAQLSPSYLIHYPQAYQTIEIEAFVTTRAVQIAAEIGISHAIL